MPCNVYNNPVAGIPFDYNMNQERIMDKVNVLLVTGLVTIGHQSRIMKEKLRDLLEATGRFEVTIVEEFRNITLKFLEPYDSKFRTVT